MNITQWSYQEQQQFSHKIDEIIHGPSGVDGSVGFVFISWPVRESSKAVLLSPQDKSMVIEVLYQVLKGLVNGPDLQ